MNDAATTREGLQMNRDQFGQSRTMSMLFVGNGLNADPDKFPISLQCLAADGSQGEKVHGGPWSVACCHVPAPKLQQKCHKDMHPIEDVLDCLTMFLLSKVFDDIFSGTSKFG